MAEAECESVYYGVIQRLATDLATALMPEIDVVINKAWSKDLIGQQQLSVSMSSGYPAIQKARDFVSVIANRVKLQSNAFTDFQKLLRSVSSLSYLANKLDRELSATTRCQNVTAPDPPPKTHPLASPQMAKLTTSEENDSGFSPDEKDSTSELEGDCCNDQPVSDDLVLSTGGGATEYVKVFQQLHGDVVALKHEEDENRAITQSERDKMLPGSLQETYLSQGELLVTGSSLPDHPRGKNESLATLKESVSNVCDEMRQKDDIIEAKKRSEDELKAQLAKVKWEKERTEGQLKEKDQEIQRIELKKKEEIEELKNQLKKKDEEVERYKSQVHQKEKETQEMKEQYESKMKQLETQNEQSKQEYQAKIQELVASLKIAEKKQKEKEIELAEMKTMLAKKEAEYSREMWRHEKEAGKLRQQLAEIKISKALVEVELEKAKRQNAEMRATAAEQKCEQKDARIQAAEAKVRKYDEARRQSDAKVHELSAELSLLKTQNSQDSTTG